jgi:Mce-associated membrane protein
MPPRRRRPVQPATRVRLPRAARSRPAADALPGAGPSDNGARLDDVRDDQVLTVPGPETSTAPETSTTPEASTTLDPALDADAADAADDVRPGGTLAPDVPATDELREDEPAADQLREDEPATDEPAAEGDVEQDAAVGGEADADRVTGATRRHSLLLPACLGVLAVLLGGLATWFGLQAGNAGSGADTQNAALINTAATRQVIQQIDAAVNTIFSYNYADTAKTSQAAQSLLTGNAIRQYNTLFRLVTQNAPKEKLVLTTTVTNSGVYMLDGNQARLLIFINQSDTSNAAHKTTAAGAMFAVNAVRQGGHWKIENINDFSGT